jgi:hypothetical protein
MPVRVKLRSSLLLVSHSIWEETIDSEMWASFLAVRGLLLREAFVSGDDKWAACLPLLEVSRRILLNASLLSPFRCHRWLR